MEVPDDICQYEDICTWPRCGCVIDNKISADIEMLRLKQSNAYDRRQDAQALRLQIEMAIQTGVTP